jgi:hypothetical protein
MYVYEAHQPYSLIFIVSIHPPPSHNYPPTLYLFYKSYVSFLVPELVFKGVSQCISTVNMFNFGQFNPLLLKSVF